MRTLLTGIWILAFCAMTTLLCAAPGSAQVELRPNLQPFPAFDLRFSTDGKAILFSTRSWNKGLGPLELVAGAVTADGGGQDVYQRVYNSDGTSVLYKAGTFVYHPAHNHFHFGDYAIYSLDPINAPGGLPKSGSKTTFCIMDTNKIDTSWPGAPQTAVYSFCGNTIQGMSIGWADTYGYYLEGQSIDIAGNPSGDYCLSIEIDPKGHLLETTDSDNVASSLVRIDVEHSTVAVLDSTGCSTTPSDVVITSIEPSSGGAGTTETVTIKGSGFAAGMNVSFENGSGPTPTAKNVTVLDSNTITAMVTIKKGGKRGTDQVWDVRVGTGILPDGFTVQR
jgi:lysyl oxidase/IPT/TIG domain-containing protein